ncbi:MAG: N-6 DNA methylase [Planctomycetaceae bacterium]|nr:N-6 DNA methylase [Planctomycetaceae bacterium]
MPVDAKPLFRPDVLRPHLVHFPWPANIADGRAKLDKWAEMFQTGSADKFKEQELLPDFLTDVFCGLLGYIRPTDNPKRFTISREKHVQVDGKFADAVLGNLRPGHEDVIVALEGKGPLDPLDRPHAGRKMSAVDQAYRYAINLPCDWIVVTSMRQTRLYFKGADQYTYERFDTEKLATDDGLLRRFVFLLGADRIAPETGRCHLYALHSASEKVGKELTREFYVRYAEMRQNAFEHLCAENPQLSRNDLLSATQKLLDRILFCAFCEDRGLLPPDTIKEAYEHRDPYHPKPIWDTFRGLFRAIDTGNAGLNIPAYNGGLFAFDEKLDNLKLPDAVCHYFQELSRYEYRPASALPDDADTAGKFIDVDILGHIFEQSITDLERLRNELEGRVEPLPKDKLKTRRKKEGAFYTPAFITRYIVEQALGSVLRDRFEQLRQQHEGQAKGTARAALADPAVYELDTLKKPQRDALVRFWEAWQDELKTVRVLDPACGSGAFLIEAFDQLHTVYQISNDRLEELRGSRSLFDPDRQILQHNLYGVDLNEEAIEICRLSLWIKTAARGKVLTSLDHTIRVGNSVVSDPQVHPRAFDWQAAFPEVFANGGFDVVVGNPPYIRQEWLAPYKAHWKDTFQSFDGVADIFTYFFEVGVKLLRSSGMLGFITSGSWVRGNYGAPLRKYIIENAALDSMIDFGEFQPFEDAEMIRPTIAVLRKNKLRGGGKLRLFKWLTSGSPPENLSDVIAAAPTMKADHLGAEAWELDPDDVLALRRKMADAKRTLSAYCEGRILYGVKTGLNEVFVISRAQRDDLVRIDPASEQIIKPFVQGTHLRPWYLEQSNDYLIFTRRGIEIEKYPAVLAYLGQFREQLEPKPADWPLGKKWLGRKPGAYLWYEIQDSVDYWEGFEEPKIVWPDISKLPRFSMDDEQRYLGNTGYVIPGGDYFLLGVLSSWAIWFYISKKAQPLRLRGDRWQYRLIAQYMEQVPIPDAATADRESIRKLAKACSTSGKQRYELETQFQRRLVQTFGHGPKGDSLGTLNTKAQDWWTLSLNELGDALKTSFKLKANPFKTPNVADEWEPYLAEKRAAVDALTRQLADAEAEINDRVYRLFALTPGEIALLQREVQH